MTTTWLRAGVNMRRAEIIFRVSYPKGKTLPCCWDFYRYRLLFSSAIDQTVPKAIGDCECVQQAPTTTRTSTTTWARGARASTSSPTCTARTWTSSCRRPLLPATLVNCLPLPPLSRGRHPASRTRDPADPGNPGVATCKYSAGLICNLSLGLNYSYQFYTTLFVVNVT